MMSEAGPSRQNDREPSRAPSYPLPSNAYFSVEYPGYVAPASTDEAIRRLGGQSAIDGAFKKNAMIELKMRPDNTFCHPILGDVIHTHNMIMKVTTRRKKRRDADGDVIMDSQNAGTSQAKDGEYTIEIAGITYKTARFRSMADFQYQPDKSDRIMQLRDSIERFDARAIKDFVFEKELEDYTIHVPAPLSSPKANENTLLGQIDPSLEPPTEPTLVPKSNLRLFPPPVFSRQGIQQNYNYKANPMSILQKEIDEETGLEKERLVNKQRFKGLTMIQINFEQEVPTGPTAAMLAANPKIDAALRAKLEELFEQRPMWTRVAIFNQLDVHDARETINNKCYFPLLCYGFVDGPFHDTLIKFGYDPRVDPKGRMYQRIFFRNAVNHVPRATMRRKWANDAGPDTTNIKSNAPGVGKKPTKWVENLRDRRSHIFDGVTVGDTTTGFQACDITDSLLRSYLDDESFLRTECDVSDGWYETAQFARIKTIMRAKYFGIKNGKVVTDEDCLRLLREDVEYADDDEDDGEDGSGRATSKYKKQSSRKKNRAKRGLTDAEMQAARLRAALQKDQEAGPSQENPGG